MAKNTRGVFDPSKKTIMEIEADYRFYLNQTRWERNILKKAIEGDDKYGNNNTHTV